MLYTASFYRPDHWVGQAYRVSRFHPRGLKTRWHTLPFFYPDVPLLKSYRGGNIDFATFTVTYLEALHQRLGDEAMQRWLEDAPGLGDMTFLCYEREDIPCHRRILARWLKEQVPTLELGLLR